MKFLSSSLVRGGALFLAISFSQLALAVDYWFYDIGSFELSESHRSVTFNRLRAADYGNPLFPELIVYRTDGGDEPARNPTPSPGGTPAPVCVPTVRAYFSSPGGAWGRVGLHSVTYGARLKTSGEAISFELVRGCGRKLSFTLTGVMHYNNNSRPHVTGFRR
jgi:hypothetical protein